jgi:protein-L-isoaspartate O-methyltransferase
MTLDKFAKTLLPKTIYQNLFLLRHLQKLATREGAYLMETGYINSIKNFEPVNKEGNPIPWMNYSFIDFLEPRLNQSMNIFEYGSGYSTLYLSDKVGSITSIEFDKTWFEKMKENLKDKDHCKLIYRPDQKQYIEAIGEFGDKRFDIIIVDGRDRTDCIKHVLPFLGDGGVVLLDDSWQAKFNKVFGFFKENGFRELSFTGLKPCGMIVEKTTVFYRNNNVLGI